MAEKIPVILVDPTTGLPYTTIPVSNGSTENRTASGDIASNQNVALNTAGTATVTVSVAGIWTGTLDFEFTLDDANWFPLSMTPVGGGSAVSSTAANGEWTASVAAYSQVRVIGNIVASGTANVVLSASTVSSTVVLGMALPSGDNTIGRVKVTDGADVLDIDASGRAAIQNPPNLDAASSTLATKAKQDDQINLLTSIDAKLSSQATASKQDAQSTTLSSILGQLDAKTSALASASAQAMGNSSLAAIESKDDVARSTRASETTAGVIAAQQTSGAQKTQVTNFPSSQPVTGPLTDIELRASPVPISGTIAVSNFPATQPVSGPLTNAELRAAPVPTSVASLPLPSGAAKDATLTSGDALWRLTSDKTNVASVQNTAPTTEYGVVTRNIPSGVQPVSGAVSVNNFPATQPISGTVAVSSVAGNVATTSAAASQADGHSANIGALADAASASTLTGLLKNIKNALAGALTVAQSTAANLKAQVTGAGTAGVPDVGVVSIQGVGGGTAVPISGTVTTTPSGVQAVSSTDGALNSLGAQADAEATGNGTLIAIAKRLRTLFGAGLPTALAGGRLDVNIGSIATTIDVSDRAARLLGIAYGSLGQLKQTATNINLAVENFVGGTAIDPRSIRALTSADAVTAAISSWLGSTTPTVGQKVAASSIPVVLASDIPVAQISAVSTANSTSVALGANATFTGTFEDALLYSDLVFLVLADQASATNGLVVQYSNDGVIVHDSDVFTIPAANGQQFSVGRKGRYFRVVYTNGAIAQASFSLGVIKSAMHVRDSTVKLGDSIDDQQDTTLETSCLKARTAAGAWVPILCSTDGVLAAEDAAGTTPTVTKKTLVANTNQNMAAADTTRRGVILWSDSQFVSIKLGATAGADDYSFQLPPLTDYVVPDWARTLQIDAICSSAAVVRVTTVV